MNDNDVAHFIRARVPEPDVEHDLDLFRSSAQRANRRRATARVTAAVVSVAAVVSLAFVWSRDASPDDERLDTTATTRVEPAPTTGPAPSSDLTSLLLALRSLDLENDAIPAAWLTLEFCGVDRGRDDTTTRRCFLDAHLARYPAVMLDTNNEAITVFKTRVDGGIEFVATAKGPQTEREWAFQVCERLSTRPPSASDDPTAWEAVNCQQSTPPEMITRPQPPEWFLSRTEVPLCGLEATVEQDRADRNRQCFVDAYGAGRSAEFAFSGTSQSPDISYVTYWFRVIGPNQIDVIARQESRSWPPVGGEPYFGFWVRYECSSLEFRDLLPRLVPQACRVVER